MKSICVHIVGYIKDKHSPNIKLWYNLKGSEIANEVHTVVVYFYVKNVLTVFCGILLLPHRGLPYEPSDHL